MLKLAVKVHSPQEVILTATGWITATNVTDLEREMQRWRGQTQRLILELADIRAIDENGLKLLRCWSSPPLELRGNSAFLQALLATEGLELNA